MSDLFKKIPMDLEGNLRWRQSVQTRCIDDKGFRSAMLQACADDCLFFFNGFCWVYEPRPRKLNGKMLPKQIPFIAWDHQVPAIKKIEKHLGLNDVGVEKSRGEGASWMGVLFAVHNFLFAPMSAIGIVSKDERAADDPKNPDSIGWKIDWELTRLPRWMSGEKNVNFKRELANHSWTNLDNKSTISAFAATGNVASGGRKSWFLMDELAKFPRGPDEMAMASTQHVTDCRLVVSTPLGSDGAYYDLMHTDSNLIKVILDWKQNPVRNRGLYKFENYLPVAVDETNPLPEDYVEMTDEVKAKFERLRRRGFKLEGVERSPWYDDQCDRGGATPQNIAQELDRDYGGSSYKVFGNDFQECAEDTVQKPTHEGDIDFDTRTLEPDFHHVENGPLKVWTPLGYGDMPPARQYVIGCDVSNGLGGSYTSSSTAMIFELVGEELQQVGEWTGRTTPPQEFADLSISLCKMFHNAYLAWEHNGPGAAFTRRVLHQEYTNIYYRRSLTRRKRTRKTEPGWWTDERTKTMMFTDFRKAVKDREIILRSADLVKECNVYVFKNGKIEHGLVAGASDDAKGVSHGDRVIGAAIAYQASKDCVASSPYSFETTYAKAPTGSFAERHKEFIAESTSRDYENDWQD